MSVTLTTCENCRTKFEAKRSTARFCSTKCRVYIKRGKTPTANALYYRPDTFPAEKLQKILETKAEEPDVKLCKNNHILNRRGYCDVKGCK